MTPGSVAAATMVGAVAALLAVSCGDTTSRPAWVAGHPDTSLLTFVTTAPGVCAITVQYPNDAPAAIDYQGSVYVQVGRQPHLGAPAGKVIDQSGDWRVFMLGDGDLLLVTSSAAFEYRLEDNC